MKPTRLFWLICLDCALSVHATQSGYLNRATVQILEPLSLLIVLLYRVCWITGGTFLMGAILRYFQYRRNAGEAHLSQTFTLGILGLVLLLLPFIAQTTRSSKYKFYIQQHLLQYY